MSSFQVAEDGNYPPEAISTLTSVMVNETFKVQIKVSAIRLALAAGFFIHIAC